LSAQVALVVRLPLETVSTAGLLPQAQALVGFRDLHTALAAAVEALPPTALLVLLQVELRTPTATPQILPVTAALLRLEQLAVLQPKPFMNRRGLAYRAITVPPLVAAVVQASIRLTTVVIKRTLVAVVLVGNASLGQSKE
jgi:hypothetical protein